MLQQSKAESFYNCFLQEIVATRAQGMRLSRRQRDADLLPKIGLPSGTPSFGKAQSFYECISVWPGGQRQQASEIGMESVVGIGIVGA
jgi:hypothetical protein